MYRSPLPLIALTLSLTACAEMDWTRPGADNALVSRDLDECRGAALGRAAPPGMATARESTTTVGASAAPARPAGSANERFVAEHEAVRQCMAAKGYRLTPAP